jgi:nucleotide-binding universal stress UspA family protein
MTIRKILVPLDGNQLNQAVLDTALAGARRFQAHLEVLYVRPDPREMLPYATLGMSDAMKQTVIDAAQRSGAEIAKRVRAAFEQFCHDNKLSLIDKPPVSDKASASWHEETGHPGEALIRRGRLSDLIFVARPGEERAAAATLETALLETGRPVVVVPPKSHKCIASRITLGWNASAEAARAVSRALPCLISAEAVTVLVSRRRVASAEELAEYLAWHDVKAAVKVFNAGSRSAGETLLEESRKLKADLLVIGGYSHTRARELLFGGVTSYILEAADIPVFMTH